MEERDLAGSGTLGAMVELDPSPERAAQPSEPPSSCRPFRAPTMSRSNPGLRQASPPPPWAFLWRAFSA